MNKKDLLVNNRNTLKKYLFEDYENLTSNEISKLEYFMYSLNKHEFYTQLYLYVPYLYEIREDSNFDLYERGFRLKIRHNQLQVHKHIEESKIKYKPKEPIDALELLKDKRILDRLSSDYEDIMRDYDNFHDILEALKDKDIDTFKYITENLRNKQSK